MRATKPGRRASARPLAMVRVTVRAAAALVALFLVDLAFGADTPTTLKLAAALSTAQQVPKPAGAKGGTGTFHATLTSPSHPIPGYASPWTLRYQLTWKRLSSPVTAADIHFGKPGKVGPYANTELCSDVSDCGSGVKAGGEMPEDVAKRLQRGAPMYVEVYTKKNPKGEIRGQIKVVK